jgi:endo-1,4-beta-xylanase
MTKLSLLLLTLGLATTQAQSSTELLAQAQERIPQFRQGVLKVKVTDAQGQTLSGVSVKVEQQRHQFLFGGAAFNIEPGNEGEEQQRYQKAFLDIFNYATLPFYWGSFEPEQSKPRYERMDALVAWARAQGLALKGHPLIWHQVYPGWAPTEAGAAIALLEQRTKEIIQHYQDDVTFWDVINEANSSESAPGNGVSNWLERDGSASVVATALNWAREAGGQTLLYNDFQLTNDYLDLIRTLQTNRTAPDILGLQSHQHSGAWTLADVGAKCTTFSDLGLPLHFTEVTFVSGDLLADWSNLPTGPWPSTLEGEARQAEHAKNFYTMLYGCPAVEAITWWDVSDKNAWLGAPSGLLRADMTAKPAYEVLQKLIKGTWWTNAAGQTNGEGVFTTRATLGTHEVTVSTGTTTVRQTVEVTKNGDGETVLNVRLQ